MLSLSCHAILLKITDGRPKQQTLDLQERLQQCADSRGTNGVLEFVEASLGEKNA